MAVSSHVNSIVMVIDRILRTLALPLAVVGFAAIYLLEKKRPLRDPVESKPVRNGRNLIVAATAGAAMYLIERPVAERAASLVERRQFGLLKLARLPKWFERIAALVLLDYTLYLWHVLTHRVPALWRFHVVHHADLDLDASTAFRFHFGEIAISVAWRAAQIVVIGVSPDTLKIWHAFLLPSIIFHHSNLKLPESIERPLSKIIVTPRLHGIHHSIVREETDSNWSSGLSVWDRLHGTYRGTAEHVGITIGVPAFRRPGQVTLGRLLEMPFIQQRSSWTLNATNEGDER